ncbi:MAG: DUF3467 domain-containing protein [Alphaproteobacteria bacterium]
MEDNKKKQEQVLEEIKIKTTQEKLVPKFCTNITTGLLKNKNIVLTMAYSEGQESTALIERIVIDLEHARQLKEVLEKILNENINDN